MNGLTLASLGTRLGLTPDYVEKPEHYGVENQESLAARSEETISCHSGHHKNLGGTVMEEFRNSHASPCIVGHSRDGHAVSMHG